MIQLICKSNFLILFTFILSIIENFFDRLFVFQKSGTDEHLVNNIGSVIFNWGETPDKKHTLKKQTRQIKKLISLYCV